MKLRIKIIAIAVILTFIVVPLRVLAQERETKTVRITGMEEGLLINLAIPDILDLRTDVNVIMSFQRPDTFEFIDPTHIKVTLSFMGYKMAESESPHKLSTGIYYVTFPAVLLPLLLSVKVEADWVAPWGEVVHGEASKNLMLNFFENITGRILSFFENFFGSHNITGYIQSIYEKFATQFSGWMETVTRFSKLLRLTAKNFFGFRKSAQTRLVILNVSDLELIYKYDPSTIQTTIYNILQKARLIPHIDVINDLDEYYQLLYNGTTNVILVAPVTYFPVYNASDWETALANVTVTIAENNWRIVLFNEPFKYLYFNNTKITAGIDGWRTFCKWAGITLFSDPPDYTVLNNVKVVGTTLLDRIASVFNISIERTIESDVIAVPKTFPTRWVYELTTTDYVTLFMVDSSTGVSLVVGIPSLFDEVLYFSVGLIGWDIIELIDRVKDIIFNQILNVVQNLPFYDDIVNFANSLADIINSDFSLNTILNKIYQFGENLSKFIVSPFEWIFSGLSGLAENMISYISDANEGPYGNSGADTDIFSAMPDIITNIIQHLQSTYLQTIMSLMSNLPSYLGAIAEAVKEGKLNGLVNYTKNLTQLLSDPSALKNMTAEALTKLTNTTLNTLENVTSSKPEYNPFLMFPQDMKSSVSEIQSDLDKLVEKAETITTPSLTALELRMQQDTDIVEEIRILLENISEKIGIMKEKVNEYWYVMARHLELPFVTKTVNETMVSTALSTILSYIQQIINASLERFKTAPMHIMQFEDLVDSANKMLQDIQNIIDPAFDWLYDAFNQFANWVLELVNNVRNWVGDLFTNLVDSLTDAWNNFVNGFIEPGIQKLQDMLNNIKSGFINFIDGLKSGFTWLWDRIRDVGSTLYNFFVNLPDNFITMFKEVGYRFLRITFNVIKTSTEWILERVLSYFGFNYYKIMNAIKSVWNAIFKVINFIKNAFQTIPNMFANFTQRLRDTINYIVEFIKGAISQVTNITSKLFDGFNSITKIFSTFAGFIGEAKEFLNRLFNVTQWLGVIKYSLNQIKQKTTEITKTFVSTAKESLKLGNAFKGTSIRILGRKGSTLYFSYVSKGTIVKNKALKVSLCGIEDNKLYGYSIASEVAPGVYAVDLKNLNAEENRDYTIVVEEFKTSTSATTDDNEVITATAEVLRLTAIKTYQGKVAGYMIVEYPKTLYADATNYIKITIVNEKNVYRDVDIVITLLKSKVPLSQYTEIMSIVPGNNTRTVGFGPFTFALPGKAKLRIEFRQDGSTVAEVDVNLQLGIGNYLILSGITILVSVVVYLTISVLKLKKMIR